MSAPLSKRVHLVASAPPEPDNRDYSERRVRRTRPARRVYVEERRRPATRSIGCHRVKRSDLAPCSRVVECGVGELIRPGGRREHCQFGRKLEQ